MLRKIVVGVLSSALAVVVACGSEEPKSQFGTSSGDADGGTSGEFRSDSGPPPVPVECRKMDIVFVVDNSQSMEQEQANLAKNFPEFIKVINEYRTQQGDLLEYRVAITTSDDVADQGRFRKSRGQGADQSCNPLDNGRPWFVREDNPGGGDAGGAGDAGGVDDAGGAGDAGGVDDAGSGSDAGSAGGDISGYFACRAQVGTFGSNVERPLEAARLSVTDRIEDGSNAFNGESFVRDDALLAFVVITDEDEGGANDSSPLPAPKKEAYRYAEDFDKVKAGFRGRWAAAVIAGETACESPELGQAAEAVRLRQFITTVGKNGVFSNICQGDLTQGLRDALAVFTQACKGFPGVK